MHSAEVGKTHIANQGIIHRQLWWVLWQHIADDPHVREALNWHLAVRVGGDGSTCDSLGAALGRSYAGWGSSGMMTIKGVLAWKCHVKELKPGNQVREKGISNLFWSLYEWWRPAFVDAWVIMLLRSELSWTQEGREKRGVEQLHMGNFSLSLLVQKSRVSPLCCGSKFNSNH